MRNTKEKIKYSTKSKMKGGDLELDTSALPKPSSKTIEDQFNNLTIKEIVDFHDRVQNVSFMLDVLDFRIAMKNPDLLLTFWTSFMFLARYTLMHDQHYNSEVRGSSANGKFTILTVLNNDKKLETLFLKFQIEDAADNMMLDDVNGYMINNFAMDDVTIKRHFMRYRDSCLTIVRRDRNGTNPKFYFDITRILKHQTSTDYIYNPGSIP